MTTAVYPGTFDPFTLGHLDVLKRAARLFDRVILAVAESEKKKTLFTLEERIALAQASCEEEQGLENVTVEGFRGLLCDFAKARGVTVSVRGARAVSDFEYEFQQALINKELYSGVETVFLTTSAVNQYLSSSVVKQIASLGGDIHPFVPEQVHDRIVRRLRQDEEQENQQ